MFQNHLSSIRRYKDNCVEPTKVASHFNLENHNISDISFQIFINNFIVYRTRLEEDLIILLNTREPLGMNKDEKRKIRSLVTYSN